MSSPSGAPAGEDLGPRSDAAARENFASANFGPRSDARAGFDARRSGVRFELAVFAVAALSAAGAGCRATDVALATLPDPGVDYFFFVAVDAQGQPGRTSAIYGTAGGQLTFGGTPLFPLRPSDRGALIVGLTRAELTTIHGGFDTHREGQLGIKDVKPPEAAHLFAVGGDSFVDTALPGDAPISEASDHHFPADVLADLLAAVHQNITLTVPVDPEYCRIQGEPELTPFGPTGNILPSEKVVPGESDDEMLKAQRHDLQAIAILDRDRVIAVAEQAMYIFHRGVEPIFPASPRELDPYREAELVLSAQLGAGVPSFRGVALDRAHPLPDGSLRMVVAGKSGDKRPRIWDFIVSAHGMRLVAGATIAEDLGAIDRATSSVAIDPHGNAVAVGANNLLLVRTASATVFSPPPHAIEDNVILDFRIVKATGDPQRPWFIAEDSGALYLGDIFTGRWDRYLRGDRPNDRRFYGLGVSPDVEEFWAVGPKGSVFRRAGDDPWRLLVPSVPPRFYPCAGASSPDGTVAFTRTLRAVAIDDIASYLIVDDCNAVLRMRRADLCASVISFENIPITTMGAAYRDIQVYDGQLLTAGARGSIYGMQLDTGAR